jgi:hypothetical protein
MVSLSIEDLQGGSCVRIVIEELSDDLPTNLGLAPPVFKLSLLNGISPLDEGPNRCNRSTDRGDEIGAGFGNVF